MTCRSKAEEGSLATAVLSLVHWLVTVAVHAFKKLVELGTSTEHTAMLSKSTDLCSKILDCDFASSMLCLARLDDRGRKLLRVKKLYLIKSFEQFYTRIL